MARSAHIEKACFEAIFLGSTAAYFEPPVSTIEAKVHPVLAGCEVGLELEFTSIRDEITNVPEAERIFPGQRRVIPVEASLEPVDMNEGFPGAVDRLDDPIINHEHVATTGFDRVDRMAIEVDGIPTEHVELVA